MLFRRLKSGFLILSLACVTAFGFAQNANMQDVQDVQNTLRRAQGAARKLNYSGTFVYQQSNQIRTSRITHGVDQQGEIEKLEILDGKPREYLRRNDEVACYLPESKSVQIEKGVTQEVFPALLSSQSSSLPDFYYIKKAELSRVAGLECQILSFEPKDTLRYGYRLCLEKASGLILRAQTMNPKNEVIEQIAFTQIAIGDIDKSRIRSSFSNVAQWRVENLTVQANINSGWSVKLLPPGFKKTREMKRLIPISVAANGTNPNQPKTHEVVQIIFSDGLSAISVFIEPDSAGRTEGSLQQGAMTLMGRRQGEYWLTVVGEVPFAAIKQVLNSIEFTSK